MDKFQVYNREAQSWEDENIKQISGWSENWVLDKTTDSAKIKLKYKGIEKPNWHNGDWCRILHLTGNETGATYTEKDYTWERIDHTFDTEDFLIKTVTQNTINIKRLYNIGSPINMALEVEIYYLIGQEPHTEVFSYNFTFTNETPIFEKTFTNEDIPDATYIEIAYSHYEELFPQRIRIGETKKRGFIPLNHEQYIIKNPIMVVDKVNEEIDIQLDLVEPIEITQGIVCETMSFTNQIEKVVNNTTYSHEPLNHHSVLEKILKVTPANNDNYNYGYQTENNKSWYNRIKNTDRELLESIFFNDETYSEPTLYEILLNKFDSSVGRTPVLYFDIDGATDKPFNNTRDEYILQFERQDGFDKENIELNDLTYKASQIMINENAENFADGLVSNYDNLAPNNTILRPAKELWLVPEINTNERDLRQYDSQKTAGTTWCLKLPHNIKSVYSLRRFYMHTDWQSTELIATTSTDFGTIIEVKQYNASSFLNQRGNYAWFKEGENLIFLNEAYYLRNEAVGQNEGKIWVYQVIYEPLISGRYDLGKDYQVPINQNDSQIDSEKFGKYLKEYFASMNKADLTITKTIDNWADIKEIGTRVIDNNKEYVITNVSIQARKFNYDIVYQLNENHIRKSDVIQAPQEIRKNIEISVDATKERKSMFSKDIKLSLNAIENINVFNVDKQKLFSSILNNYSIDNIPQLAYFTFKSKYPFVQGGNTNLNLLCEIAKYSISNTICFNMKYIDNAEAGKNKTFTWWYDGTLSLPSGQTPILYTDIFGEFDEFNVKLLTVNNIDITTIPPSSLTNVNKIRDIITKMATYPLTTSIGSSSINNPILSIDDIKYYKDMLDTFNYTLGIHYEADKNIIYCSNFFKNNILMTNENVQFTKVKSYTTNINETDYAITAESGESNVSSVNYSNGTITIDLASSLSAKSIALVDENDNPLIIINDYDKIENSTFSRILLYC